VVPFLVILFFLSSILAAVAFFVFGGMFGYFFAWNLVAMESTVLGGGLVLGGTGIAEGFVMGYFH
jgi:hypothetical protein